MTALYVVVAVGTGSYLFRVSMLVVAARGGLPQFVERAARDAVAVSFTALAAGAFVAHMGDARVPLAPLIAVAVAIVAVLRTGTPHAALVAGMPALWVLSAVLPA